MPQHPPITSAPASRHVRASAAYFAAAFSSRPGSGAGVLQSGSHPSPSSGRPAPVGLGRQVPQLARGLNAQGVGKWRDYAAELAPVQPLLEPWVAKFGAA